MNLCLLIYLISEDLLEVGFKYYISFIQVTDIFRVTKSALYSLSSSSAIFFYRFYHFVMMIMKIVMTEMVEIYEIIEIICFLIFLIIIRYTSILNFILFSS